VNNIWRFRGEDSGAGKAFPSEVLEACDGSPLLAQLLANRGVISPEQIRAFLNLADYMPTHANQLPDAQAAVERIARAIESQECILIYGDFDVDGITGTSVLYEALKKHLKANVSYYIPDRATEGHGLNTAALVRLTSTRCVKLVITTDTGITNFSEVSLLNGLGIDTVITDHHALPENLPPAIANVNPQRLLADNPDHPLGPMCGAGVAYKLCELLLERFLGAEPGRAAAESLLDIVAVGTVVDMVPLVRENRYLVYRGLQVLNQRKRQGFQELLQQAGANMDAPINSETLGFTIGPRLNALGRLERADQGVELLTGDDPERVRVIAAHLEFLNRKRRDLCDQTFLEADSHLQRQGGLGDNRCIILGSPDWNPGIIGIVASRLIEKYHVPVFMMVIDESKGVARCSARSIPDFHLHDNLLKLEEYFLNFGGHGGAAGFSVKRERLEAFKRELYALCNRTITDEQMKPVVAVDLRLDWSQINPHLLSLIDRVGPFGMDNPSPRFVLEPVQIAAQRRIGEGDRHLKLILTPVKKNGNGPTLPLDGLLWNVGPTLRLDAGCDYGFVVNPGLNNFNGVTKVQLIIEDYRISSDQKPVTIDAGMMNGSKTPAPSAGGFNASQPIRQAAQHKEARPSGQPSIAEIATESGPQWLDHRGRDELDGFIAQLMRPLANGRSVLIYHEGRAPEIPFLDTSLLAGRFALRSADELILWDLPPSHALLETVLQSVRPSVVHLTGGKARSVPIFQPERNYLTLMLQLLRREQAQKSVDGASVQIALDDFAGRLATSESVISHGLLLLARLGQLRVKLLDASLQALPPENTSAVAPSLQVDITLLSAEANSSTSRPMAEQLEYALFQKALAEVLRYRGWLLKSPLVTIKAAFSRAAFSSYVGDSLPLSPLNEPLLSPQETVETSRVQEAAELVRIPATSLS
jgi:single-stranded-DNA-specific exonuclease RecJ